MPQSLECFSPELAQKCVFHCWKEWICENIFVSSGHSEMLKNAVFSHLGVAYFKGLQELF